MGRKVKEVGEGIARREERKIMGREEREILEREEKKIIGVMRMNS
jgi:hypothetical protein